MAMCLKYGSRHGRNGPIRTEAIEADRILCARMGTYRHRCRTTYPHWPSRSVRLVPSIHDRWGSVPRGVSRGALQPAQETVLGCFQLKLVSQRLKSPVRQTGAARRVHNRVVLFEPGAGLFPGCSARM